MIDKVATLVRDLPPSGIRRFFDLVAETPGVISLGVGEPDFVTPWAGREACIWGLEKGKTHYTSNHGLLELREAISRDVEYNFGVTYDPRQEIMVTVGVSEALDIALRALLNPGDEVIIPEPSYVSYQPCTLLAGGKPVPVATRWEDGFRLTPAALAAALTPRTKAVLLCYPNNPTGTTLGRRELEGIAEIVRTHDLIVIADEIYHHLTYGGKHFSITALPGMKERTILLNGFSKAYAMTGWRLGYVCGHPDLISAMVKIHQYTMLCAPITAQLAALEVLKSCRSEMEAMVKEYDRRRRLVVAGLREAGLECQEPEGAFYVFPSIRSTGLSSEEFATQLLKEQKVAVVPGSAFGPAGEGCIRISYAYSLAQLQEALRRIKLFVQKRMAG